MTTALDLITRAARLAGIVFKSEALAADEANDGLESLNDMLASWSNNGLNVVSRVRDSFVVSPAASYTIGAGQTLNTARPIVIRSAFVRVGGTDYELTPISDEEYEEIPLKTTATTYPSYINYDNAYPYGTIRLYPLLAGGAELHLLSEKEISQFTALTDTANLAPGWNKAIVYNLAVDIAPEYGLDVPPATIKGANDAMDSLRIAIAKNRPIKYNPSRVQIDRTALFNSGYFL